MDILMFSERFWPEGGGGTLATYLVTKLMAKELGFHITVVTGTLEPAKIGKVSFIIDPALRAAHKPGLWFQVFRPSTKERYIKLMKKFDTIYIPYGYPIIPIAKEVDRKVVVHVHDYQSVAYNSTILYDRSDLFLREIINEFRYEILEHNSFLRAMAGSLLAPTTTLLYGHWTSEADLIICVSNKQAEIITSRLPQLDRKVRVIYNPLPNVPVIEKRLGDPTFMYLGGDSYVKGFLLFLEASRRILNRVHNVKFLLAGDFKDKNTRIIKRLNERFSGSFNLLGHLRHKEVLRSHSFGHALLFPSICEEPLPYAVIEAMLAGTIPIASRVGGMPEIVNGTQAEKFLLEPGHVDELADRMGDLVSLSKEEFTDIGVSLRKSVLQRFNNDDIKKRLLDVFDG